MIKTMQKDQTKLTEDKLGSDMKDVEEGKDVKSGKARDQKEEVESEE